MFNSRLFITFAALFLGATLSPGEDSLFHQRTILLGVWRSGFAQNDAAIKIELRTINIVEKSFILLPTTDSVVCVSPRFHLDEKGNFHEMRIRLRVLEGKNAKIALRLLEIVPLLALEEKQPVSHLDGDEVTVWIGSDHSNDDPFKKDSPTYSSWSVGDAQGILRKEFTDLIESLPSEITDLSLFGGNDADNKLSSEANSVIE